MNVFTSDGLGNWQEIRSACQLSNPIDYRRGLQVMGHRRVWVMRFNQPATRNVQKELRRYENVERQQDTWCYWEVLLKWGLCDPATHDSISSVLDEIVLIPVTNLVQSKRLSQSFLLPTFSSLEEIYTSITYPVHPPALFLFFSNASKPQTCHRALSLFSQCCCGCYMRAFPGEGSVASSSCAWEEWGSSVARTHMSIFKNFFKY
jgi:hypothetical protein